MKPITGQEKPEGENGGGGGLFTSRRRAGSAIGWAASLKGVWSSPWLKGLGTAFGGLLIGYLVATVLLFPAAAQSSGLLVAPDFLGQDVVAAEGDVAALGLGVGRVDTIQHPRASEGMVLGQDPLPGQLVEPDGLIRFTISAGPVSLPVPAVLGRQMSQAIDLLEAAGFTYAADTVESDEPAGNVVEADPSPGERVTLPRMVQLQVSLGPPMVTLPRLVGLEEAAALQVLDSLGLEVSGVEERFRFGLDQGRVIEQEPAAGVSVEHGSAVRLVVGRRGGG